MSKKQDKSTIIDEYLFYQEKYAKMYGKENTIVFMQIGGFYECYSTENRGFDLSKISEITNLVKTKRDKKLDFVNEKNPYMTGFTISALDKFLKLMVDAGLTVIIISQITPPPSPKRAVTGIYSAGTYINDTNSAESNNIVSLYIEDENQMTGGYLTCIGMSSVDLSTGTCIVHEVFSINSDEKKALDECYRFILSQNPKEILIHRKEIPNVSMKKDNLIAYLELENKNIHYETIINKAFNKLSYQNEFFGKIYKDHGMLSPIEYIDMEKMSYARMSFLILLDFAYKHNENLISNLDKPVIFANNLHLILGNNAIYQLNILENNTLETFANNKFKSLMDVINATSTAMGRRYLKNTICNPLNDAKEINLRYNCTEELIKDNLYLDIEKHLGSILDIERLGRKVCLAYIHPYEYANLMESFNEIDNIIKLLEDTKYNVDFVPDKIIQNQMKEFIDTCNKTFDITELKKQNLNDITGSFFKKGIFSQIDELQDSMINNIQFMKDICKVLSDYIDDGTRFSKNNKNNKNNKTNNKSNNKKKINKIKQKDIGNSDEIYEIDDIDIDVDEINEVDEGIEDIDSIENLKIQLKRNDRDGYYLSLTKRRAKILQEKIKDMENIPVNDIFSVEPTKLEFKELAAGNTKIFFKDLGNKSNDVLRLKEKLINLVKKKYIDLLINYGSKYKNMFKQIALFIAKIDFIKSNAKIAKLYNYTKPEIILNDKNGYINCKKLRHPIIERIRTDVEYVPHDICIGKPQNYKEGDELLEGMLLFGLNSSGKSSLMKAIGLSIIMAQSGMYVPCEKYQYSPYELLFARITGNDNIFKGLSSFALEMTELRAILKRTGPKTLVIGDELTKGTEHISGNAIVASSIIKLSKTGSSFIFATHLHEIPTMKRIQELKNVHSFHLTVEFDKKNDLLIFDRKLKPGSGESMYGLTVARYILKDDEFMLLAQEIKNELINVPNKILNDKTSNYNSEVFMHECALCGKPAIESSDYDNNLDSHHIIEQNKFNKDKFTEGKSIKRDQKNNLLVICKSCHHKIHDSKEIEVKGYLDTSKGRKILLKNKNKKNILKKGNIILEE